MVRKKSNKRCRQILLNFYRVQKLLHADLVSAAAQQVYQFEAVSKAVGLDNVSHLILKWLANEHYHEQYYDFSRCNRRQLCANFTLGRIILLKLLADLIEHLGECLLERSLFDHLLTAFYDFGLATFTHIKMLVLLQFFKHLMLLSFILECLNHLLV